MYKREEDRGIIQDQQHFHQKVIFSGMRWGKRMPTDIDAVMEFGDKVLVFWELKYGDAQIPKGQELLYKRIADAWTKDGKEAVLFLCSHMTPSDEDIQLHDTVVTKTYYRGKWYTEKVVKRTKERTDEFLRWCEAQHPDWKLNIDENIGYRSAVNR